MPLRQKGQLPGRSGRQPFGAQVGGTVRHRHRRDRIGRTPAANGRQQLLGVLRQQQERSVGRRLLDALEQDVLPLLVQVLRAREQIDLALPFVRADIQIGAGIADELDGNGLLLGVIHDADVRVRAVKHLAALRADAAGAFAGRGALHGGAEDTRKRVPPGALRPGQQEAVRQLALGLQRRKALLQRIVSQKRRKLHAVPSCCILIYYVIIPLNASFFYLYF